MISSYINHYLFEEALQLFVLALRVGLVLTGFTLSNALTAIYVLPSDHGSEVHSLVLKLGMESDTIVLSSLMSMYSRFGLIDHAGKIFCEMGMRDLISWNTMIIGLARNGRAEEAINLFDTLVSTGPPPDRITLYSVLEACLNGDFLDQGLSILSSMKERYGVVPGQEHYNCIINLLVRHRKLEESVNLMQRIPYEASYDSFCSILRLCIAHSHGDLELVRMVAEAVLNVEPKSERLLPYKVLSKEYERRGKWEEMVRVRKLMKESGLKKLAGSSWIGIKNCVSNFTVDHLQHHGEQNLYSILRLLNWDLEENH